MGRNQQFNLECVLSEAPATIQAGDRPRLIKFHVSIATLLRSISEDAYKTQVCGASSTVLDQILQRRRLGIHILNKCSRKADNKGISDGIRRKSNLL